MKAKLNSSRRHSLGPLVRPIVRLCLRLGVRYQELSSEIERAYVELAKAELRATSKEVSASKLSVMTGIRRPSIAAIMRRRNSGGVESAPADVAARVIGAWTRDQRFLTSGGTPRDLKYSGLSSEFAVLVRAVSSDLNHHTVLFELERLGVAHRVQSRLHLDVESYVTIDRHEGLAMLAADINDLSAAVQSNIESTTKTPHLHARTIFDNIAVSDLPKIRRWLLALGRQVHKRANQYLAKYDRDINPETKKADEPRARVMFGTFSNSVALKPGTNISELEVESGEDDDKE